MRKPRARERKPPRVVWFVADNAGVLSDDAGYCFTESGARMAARTLDAASPGDAPHTVHRYVLDERKGRGVKRT